LSVFEVWSVKKLVSLGIRQSIKNELTTISRIDIVKQICKTLEKKLKNTKLKKLIKFVEDRPGHDFRYAVDSSKINNELKWISKYKFKDSLDHTINWYIKNKFWWQQIINKGYKLKRIGKNNEKKI
jgi:dTDP-glucose 4,6-dehydratase